MPPRRPPVNPSRPAPLPPRPPVTIDEGPPAALPEGPIAATISGMAYGGQSVARLADGQVVFVWGALPGEEIILEVTERRKRLAQGRLLEVTKASADRVEPTCPLVGTCGGCQWQFMSHAAQLKAKQEILLDHVRQAYPNAGERLRPALAMLEPWRYRNSAHFVGDAEGRPSFRAWQSHTLVPVEDCPITRSEVMEAALQYSGRLQIGERLSIRVADDTIQAWRSSTTDQADRAVTSTVLGREYRLSPQSFFQVNTKQEPRPPTGGESSAPGQRGAATSSLTDELVRLVLQGVTGATHRAIVDAYSGVGLFALALAGQAPRVYALEESPAATLDALANVEQAGLDNVVALQGTAEGLLPSIAEAISAIVLDPPRAGVDPRALAAISERAIQRIVYVSCNPSTLGRDLALLARGGYELDWLRLVDLFPHTLHIESVAVLTLR